MPVIRKINQPDKAVQKEDVLKDQDEVFYCLMSKEIFRNYEDYFDRIMFLNSTVWTCALTSRPNLTYAEALQSERDARRVLRRFPYELKAPLVFIANCTQRSGISDLVDDVFSYVATRFFREETVSVLEKNGTKEVWRECEVLSVLPPVVEADGDPLADALPSTVVDPATVRYKVRRIPDEETKKLPEAFVVTGQMVRRPRYVMSKDKLKLFMKQCVECNEMGMLKVKPSSYSKCVTDGGVSKFGDIWVGKAPVFEASKWLQSRQRKEKELTTKEKTKGGDKSTKKSASKKDTDTPNSKENKKPAGKQKDKKLAANQPGISHYFAANNSKDGSDTAVKSAAAKKEVKISKEELLRIRKAKEEAEAAAKLSRIEEHKRKKVEFNQLLLATLKSFNRIAEDLELPDQRPLPVPKPVRTLIPNELLGDALFVVEFLYSFQSVLECTDKFPRGYSLALMERSLLYREVAGPLSDTIQVLLGTVFSLQIEEANEVLVEYLGNDHFEAQADSITNEWDVAVRDASLATNWTQKFLSTPLAELPMDANTVSELLRLHLLTSGAREAEECAKWRYLQRGGYRNVDDPGLALRVKNPHILHELSTKTVYELKTEDVLQILMCLVNQIVTYSTVRDKIDERLDKAYCARNLLRTHYASERRRELALKSERNDLQVHMKKKLAAFEGSAAEKKDLKDKLQRELDDKLHSLDVRAERSKAEFNTKLMECRQEIFSYQMQLGVDRAYRTYWLFESLPGLFVECPARIGGCMAVPVEHNAALARLTNESDRLKYIHQMAIELHSGDKENKVQNTLDAKATSAVVAEKHGQEDATIATSTDIDTELLMCTGAPDSCPVHGRQPTDWVFSVLHTEQELDALIAGLNARGHREKALKEQLEGDRELILNHIADCDVQRLQVRDTDREKCVQALSALPNYGNANMGFPANTSVTDVTEGTLVDNIAELERRVTEGHLGTMRVPDKTKWRAALTEARDDGQSDKLCWGPDDAFSKANRVLGKTTAVVKTDVDSNTSVTETLNYVDPGLRVAAAPSDTDSDAAAAAERVYHIARSLLQVSQSIDPQFLRQPFGASVKLKDAGAIRAATELGQQALLKWQVSLMNAISYSQVFLHYTLLEDSIVWSRSTLNAVCRVCRRRGMPEKMLLCDGCNAGRHLFCFKPKLTKVPEGEWFCEQCQPSKADRKKRAVKRKVFSIESGDEDDMSSDDDNLGADESFYKHFGRNNEDDVRECVKCDTYSNVMLTCEVCLDRCHTGCARPPLKKIIAQWMCDSCTRLSKKQQRQLKRVKHAERRRELANYAENLANAQNYDSDSPEPDDADHAPAAPAKSRSSAAGTRASNGKRKRPAPAPVESDDDEDEESDEDSQPEVMPAKKVRNARAARVTNKRKSAASSHADEDDDDDEDSDFETLSSRRSKSSRRGSQANQSAGAADKQGRVGSRRQSTAAAKRSKKYVSTDEDEDEDDEDNQPLVNGGGRSTGQQRRSRRTDNGDESDMVLDTVACYELLNQLSKHRDAWPFERPVNRTEVPDYHLVIERPMNLAKIKSNLNLGEYRNNHELMRDIQQIFENCDVYNTSGSEIYNAGVSLEKFVESRCKELHLPFKPSDMLLTEVRINGASKSASPESSSRKSTTKVARKSRS